MCKIDPSGRGVEAMRGVKDTVPSSVLAEGDILFTAHLDDMVETVLCDCCAAPASGFIRYSRAGLRGGTHFRPLLNTPSDALRSAVEAAGLEYVIDPSNLETAQDRNYLRQSSCLR